MKEFGIVAVDPLKVLQEFEKLIDRNKTVRNMIRTFESEQRLLNESRDALVAQVRAIENTRLLKKSGKLTSPQQQKIKENLRIVLDLQRR